MPTIESAFVTTGALEDPSTIDIGESNLWLQPVTAAISAALAQPLPEEISRAETLLPFTSAVLGPDVPTPSVSNTPPLSPANKDNINFFQLEAIQHGKAEANQRQAAQWAAEAAAMTPEMKQAALLLADPLNQDVLAHFGNPSLSLPPGAISDQMIARYGRDLATKLYQLDQALATVRQRFTTALDAALANPNNPGAGDSVTPITFTHWYAQQNTDASRLFKALYGDEMHTVTTQIGFGDNANFTTTYVLGNTGVCMVFHFRPTDTVQWEPLVLSGEDANGQGVFLTPPGTDSGLLRDPSQVVFDPLLGFVSSLNNFNNESDWTDMVIPMIIVGVATAATAGAATSAGYGTIIAAGAGAAAGSLVSAAMNGRLDTDELLRSVVVAMVTAGLTEGLDMVGVDANTGVVTDWGARIGAIGEKAAISGFIQALAGGDFSQAATMSLATSLGQEVARVFQDPNLTGINKVRARMLSNTFGSAFRALASPGNPAQAIALSFLNQAVGDVTNAVMPPPPPPPPLSTVAAGGAGIGTLVALAPAEPPAAELPPAPAPAPAPAPEPASPTDGPATDDEAPATVTAQPPVVIEINGVGSTGQPPESDPANPPTWLANLLATLAIPIPIESNQPFSQTVSRWLSNRIPSLQAALRTALNSWNGASVAELLATARATIATALADAAPLIEAALANGLRSVVVAFVESTVASLPGIGKIAMIWSLDMAFPTLDMPIDVGRGQQFSTRPGELLGNLQERNIDGNLVTTHQNVTLDDVLMARITPLSDEERQRLRLPLIYVPLPPEDRPPSILPGNPPNPINLTPGGYIPLPPEDMPSPILPGNPPNPIHWTDLIVTSNGIDPDNLADVWNLDSRERGIAIESYLGETEYSDKNGWYNVGAERNGYFPLVDFQKDVDLVSLKTVDTRGTTWMDRMQDHIDDLGSNNAEVGNKPANMILDLRVQPGGLNDARSLIQYGRARNVTVIVREFK